MKNIAGKTDRPRKKDNMDREKKHMREQQNFSIILPSSSLLFIYKTKVSSM